MNTTRIEPAFEGDQVTVCFASDEKYLPLLGVAIQSIIHNSNPQKNYDICVLHSNLPEKRVRKIVEMSRRNVSIRFISVVGVIDQEKLRTMYTTKHFSVETYYRFTIPSLFFKQEKVLYMDCDTVTNKDVAELFDTNLSSEEYVGALRDTFVMYSVRKGDIYYRNSLKLQEPLNYFQAGILLFNTKAFRENHIVEKLYITLAKYKNLRYLDQDVLNMVCEGHVKYLDGRWNVEYHMPLCAEDYSHVLTSKETIEYEGCYTNPWILHFCGGRKPWIKPSFPRSEVFWKYARECPFYEEIVYRNIEENVRNCTIDTIKHQTEVIVQKVIKSYLEESKKNDDKLENNLKSLMEGKATNEGVRQELGRIKKIMKDVVQLGDYHRKLKRIRWKVHLSWGEKRQKYITRKKELKKKIKSVEDFLRSK